LKLGVLTSEIAQLAVQVVYLTLKGRDLPERVREVGDPDLTS
jgi:hypothetical protein